MSEFVGSVKSGVVRGVMKESRDATCVLHVRAAQTFFERLRGLIGTKNSDHVGDALYFQACTCVHTWFMTYPIDIAFIDKAGMVIAVHRMVKPFSVVRGGAQAFSTIERESSSIPWPSVGQSVELIEQMHLRNALNRS